MRWQYRFLLILQKGPHQERFTFRTLLSKSEKKNSSYVQKKSFFCRNELHLVRGFQKGITLGVWSHISGFGQVVGVAFGGGCG